MTEKQTIDLIKRQKNYFNEGNTLPVERRVTALKSLEAAIEAHEREICDALRQDLGKSPTESYMCEIGLAKSEISYMLSHIRRFAKKKPVPSPIAQFPSRSYIRPVPYGNVLILSPWNYPFLLSIDPLVDAIAAGNTVLLKPGAYSPATSGIIKKLLEEALPTELAGVVTGGRKENAFLLDQTFDLIFFTGSGHVGKEVLRHAAERLTPVRLELGGKSPCVVDRTANIPLAAKRIVFGKFLNCGQTCVAPDYILVEKCVHDQLVVELKKQIRLQYGERPLENVNYGKIINEKHFRRIFSLIDPKKVIFGGASDPGSLRIEPTLLDGVTDDDAVMREEIFGPVLPLLTVSSIKEIPKRMQRLPKPLAFYIFSGSRRAIEYLHAHCRFGGGCVNDCVIHLATSYMGFGGVGESGMGSYHGLAGFEAFSHRESILEKDTWMDLPFRYQPYTKIASRLIRKLL